MELRHRLVRQTINRAVSKAMEDMTENTGRGIRKLIDLGLMFSKSENQKWFFSSAKEIVSNPKNSYNKLITRILSDIDGDTVKTVGLNLGYSSLTYGTRKLRKQQKPQEEPLPWMLIFDVPAPTPAVCTRIENFIREGREMGIYSYVFRLREQKAMPFLCEAAEEFDECFFAFEIPSALTTEQAAQSFGALHNVAVSVEVSAGSFDEETCVQAFRCLKKSRCLFGFHACYREKGCSPAAISGLIRKAIGCGCIFGVFFAAEGVSAPRRKAVYDCVTAERDGTGFPLVAFEWDRDMEEVSRKVRVPGGYRLICFDPSGGGDGGAGSSLAEILRMRRPFSAAGTAGNVSHCSFSCV